MTTPMHTAKAIGNLLGFHARMVTLYEKHQNSRRAEQHRGHLRRLRDHFENVAADPADVPRHHRDLDGSEEAVA